MIPQNMLETYEGKLVFSEAKKLLCVWSRSKQMPLTDQIIDITPQVLAISELPFTRSTMKKI